MGHFHPLLELSERNLLDRFRHCSPAHRRENGHTPDRLAQIAGGGVGLVLQDLKCQATYRFH
jgi:hypothetical protein